MSGIPPPDLTEPRELSITLTVFTWLKEKYLLDSVLNTYCVQQGLTSYFSVIASPVWLRSSLGPG